MKRFAYLAAGAFLLSGCNSMMLPSQDMQGFNPQEYYAENPIENKVEIRHAVYKFAYAAGQNKLSVENKDELTLAFSDVSPEAAEALHVRLPAAQLKNIERRDNLTKFLRDMGFNKRMVRFEAASGVRANEAEIDITYAAVVSPRCPDWRTSPITTHSNTKQGNIGCASVLNMGLMVADPHDLVRGQGRVSPDSERNAVGIRRYHEGRDPAASDSSEGGSPQGGSTDFNASAPATE